MNKKTYKTPTMQVVKLQHQSHILAGSEVAAPTSASFDDYKDGDFDWNE